MLAFLCNWGMFSINLYNFRLCRICAWGITKMETGLAKWNSHKVCSEIFNWHFFHLNCYLQKSEKIGFFKSCFLFCSSEKEELKKVYAFYSVKNRKLKLFAYSCLNSFRFLMFIDVILDLFLELLKFSEDHSPWESVEEKLSAIR